MTHELLIQRSIAVVVFLVTLGLASTGRGDENAAKAKQLYEDGLTNYNLGHYEDALHAFENGYRTKHDAAFLFNIGQCQRQLSQYENARRSFQAYLRESPKLPDDRRTQVEGFIGQMEQAIADQHNKQPPTGTEAPNGVGPASSAKVAETPAAATDVRAPSPTVDRGGSKLRVAGLVVGAVGVAAVIAGGVFYSVAKSANDSLNHPSNGVFSESSQNKRNTFQALDIAAFVVGGAAIVVGVGAYVGGWHRDRRKSLAASLGTSLQNGPFVLHF